MGLEDERKMLTGSGDPKEVREGDQLDLFHCPEAQDLPRQNTPGALLVPVSPLEFSRSGLLVPSTFPQNLSVHLGQVDDQPFSGLGVPIP